MKLFRKLILFFFVLLTAQIGITVKAAMPSFLQVPVNIQDTSKKDTINQKKPAISQKVDHRSDSTSVDRVNGIVYLIGNARLVYQDFQLDAEYIRYDQKNNIIFASGMNNDKGRYYGKPIFKSEQIGTATADSLFFNLVTQKAFVYATQTEQEGGYFSGGVAKRQPDNEIHLVGQTFSTCNLPQPHTHFGIRITKGIVTEKYIVLGPSYLEVDHVPLPIVIPFGIIPKPNKKASGLIIGTPREDATRGFMLENFGYYLGLNDYWDAKFTGTISTRGSYNLGLNSNYTKRYKFGGNISLNYASTRNGLEGTPEYEPKKDYSIQWSHSQNPNARPGTSFSASVNAKTGTYNSNTAATGSYQPELLVENALGSSINYGKVFGSNSQWNLNAAARHFQETRNKTVSILLPDVSLNMATVSPFKNKKNLGEAKWYEKINVGYNMSARNSLDTYDSLLFTKQSLKNIKNGFQHTVPINMNFNLFQYINVSSGINYNERWYFQTTRRSYIQKPVTDSVVIDQISGFKRAGDYTLSLSMGTKLYSKTLEFKKLGNIKALRHVMTPSLGVSYNPDFTNPKFGIYKQAYYLDSATHTLTNVPVFDKATNLPVIYSTFENGIYGGPSSRKSASINFGVENNVELKIANKKDTTGTGMKKLGIIQSLTINGSYNFVQKTRKLSDLPFSGRSQLSDKLSFDFNGNFNPYGVDIDSVTGVRTESAKYAWQTGKLPRLTRFGLSFNYSFNPDANKARNENLSNLRQDAEKVGATPAQAEELSMISRDPNAFVDFKIPWNFSFSYSVEYTNLFGNTPQTVNNLNFNGDFNVTPKWKVQFTSGFDFRTKNLTLTSFNIYRDLHCWDLRINWVPFGPYKSYSVDLKVKASILQDLKLSKRKSYYTRY